MRLRLFLLAMLLLPASPAWAAEVSVEATDGALAEALKTAKAGDTLRLQPGTHKGPVVIATALTLEGAGAATVEPEAISPTADAAGHYCQMAILEHQGPKAQVNLAGSLAPLWFSQVRDVIGGKGTPEIAPFADAQKAEEFADERGGGMMRMSEILAETIQSPVEIDTAALEQIE